MTEESQITIHTLPSGLRIVHRLEKSRVEYCGVTVNVGSRDEDSSRQGLAHFIEHTIFKGTERHPASYVINRMEEVGGELNAYTTKEETVVYSVFPKGHLQRAANLIGELAASAAFPDAELEKERTVVLEEIESYRDTPSENVFDLFDEHIFKHSSLAHNILGRPATIKKFSSATCREFLSEFYTASNMVFFYMGPTEFPEVAVIAEEAFAGLAENSVDHKRRQPPVVTQFSEPYSCGSHQCHAVMGWRVPGVTSPIRNALSFVANYMGGPGMNSILNVALRETRGLVYSVEASTAFFSDCGLLTVYFGCDHSDFEQCRDLVAEEFNRLLRNGITPDKLRAFKQQYIGQAIVGSENREQTALSLGRSILSFGRVRSFSEFCNEINSISPDDIRQAATMLSGNNYSILFTTE